jgi:hypothetical protein
MSEIKVPESVSRGVARDAMIAWGYKWDLTSREIDSTILSNPGLRAAIESAYRAGYENGRTESARRVGQQ